MTTVGATRSAHEERSEVWARDNQRYLVLHAEAVAARLDARRDDAEEPERAAALLADEVRAATGAPVALARLAPLFGLTRFERDLLVAAAAQELGLPSAAGPVTFARALAALPDAHWSALLPNAPLRHWRLVDLPAPFPAAHCGGLPQLPLTVDERILHALVGADTLDERLSGRAQLAEPVCGLSNGQREVAAGLAALVSPDPSAQAAVLIGEDRLTRRQAAVEVGRLLGLTTLVVDGGDVPPDPHTAELYARMLAREAALGSRLLLIEAEAAPADGGVPAGPPPGVLRLGAAARSYGVPAVLAVDDPPAQGELPVLRLPATGPADRRDLFAEALTAFGLPDDPAELADRHPLTPAAIALGVQRATRLAAVPGTEPDVAAACGALADRPLHGLAALRRPTVRLDSLVLGEAVERALRALLAQVRQRRRVHGEWGYRGHARGLAVTALFTGPSGTGKTTAAESVAAELGLDLICADLSLWRLAGGRCLVDTAGGQLALAATVTVDVGRMRTSACALAEASATPNQAYGRERSACPASLFEQDLLPSWYDNWLVVERERIRQTRLHALESLSTLRLHQKRYADAVDTALAALRADPLRESAHRAVIRAHLAEGNVAEAIRQFAACRVVLRRELGVEPSGELAELLPLRPTGRWLAPQSYSA